ncbi:MAG: low molecular weight protein-tyrosine-phosphatase [Bacteroidota bacterium]
MKILMVCLGNICRSPLAEGLMIEKLSQYNIYFQVDSAGTGGWHVGSAPDKRSISVAAENGLDIGKQVCRKIDEQDYESFDYLFAMDTSVYRTLHAQSPRPEYLRKIKLICDINEEFDGSNSENMDVPDPYTGQLNDFRIVYRMLNNLCEKWADKLVNNTRK